jgi:ligand-binding sensor domain-containing protein
VYGDKAGNVWCFMENIGLYKYDGKAFVFIGPLDNLPQHGLAQPWFYNRMTAFYEAQPGALWLASNNGIYKLHTNPVKIEHLSSLSDDVNRPVFVHQIVSDENGGFWCSSYGTGLIHYNPKTNEHKRYLFEKGDPGTTNIIYGLARKSDHELWISSAGLGVFDETTAKFSFYYDRNDINISMTSFSMVQRDDGTIWLVTDKGLLKCAPTRNKFVYNKVNVTRTDNRGYYGITEVLDDERTGRRIVATSFADGLHIYDANGKETVIRFPLHPHGEPYLIIRDIMKDQEGKILVLTRDQLYELTGDNKLNKISGLTELLPSSTVPFFYKIMQSASGDYWVGSSRHGLFHYNKKLKRWKLYGDDGAASLASKRIFAIEEDVNHNIWVAHPLDGISILNQATGTWSYLKYEEKNGLVSNVFTDLSQTPDGKMIFSTFEGMSIIDGKTRSIQNFSKSSDIFNRSIFSSVADSVGNIWALTDRGLIVLNAKGEIQREFSARDGLKGLYHAFLLTRLGRKMQICTYQGFYLFDPEQALQHTESDAPLFITGVTNQNSDLAGFGIPNDVSISYSANALSIEYALLNFLGQTRNHYRYKMEGLDENWIETFSNRVNYSGIPSGDYTFRVQTIDGKTETALNVSVSTPFWKQVWFRLLVVVVGALLIYVLYKLRLDQIRKEEQLKREFNRQLADVEMKALKAQMSPHFIFNSLNSINRYIVKAEPEKASLYLTKFSKLIRLILDNSNSKIISLEQELNSLKLYVELEALRFNNKFTYSINVNKELNPLSVGVPPMIIQPFIENAIWHGLLHKEMPGGILTISVERFGHGLQCVIEDNGVGRRKAGELKSKSVNKEKSYGMKITTDRLSMLNGESKISSVEIIDLEDGNGQPIGTKVIVKIMTAELEPEF